MIELKNVFGSYKGNPVLKDIDLTIQTGELLVIIGASGCGKTTLLKTINKLNPLDAGDILIDGISIKNIKVKQLPKLLGYVVQEGGLFPHLTVEENIALILQAEGMDKAAISSRVTEVLDMVNLDSGIYRNQFPSQLSGGQKQRVSVARAFAADPQIILMDEPFSALDPMSTTDLQDEVLRLQTQFRKTIVFVTHDMDEAIKLADRICIIQDGRVAQCDTPEQILKYPANKHVKAFVGENRLWDNPQFICAEDIMTACPLAVNKDNSIKQTMEMMRQNGLRWSIVTEDDGAFLGFVRPEDVVTLSGSEPVKDHIFPGDIVLHTRDRLSDIMKKIERLDDQGHDVMPVLTEENTVAGYLSFNGLLSTLSYGLIKEEEEESP